MPKDLLPRAIAARWRELLALPLDDNGEPLEAAVLLEALQRLLDNAAGDEGGFHVPYTLRKPAGNGTLEVVRFPINRRKLYAVFPPEIALIRDSGFNVNNAPFPTLNWGLRIEKARYASNANPDTGVAGHQLVLKSVLTGSSTGPADWPAVIVQGNTPALVNYSLTTGNPIGFANEQLVASLDFNLPDLGSAYTVHGRVRVVEMVCPYAVVWWWNATNAVVSFAPNVPEPTLPPSLEDTTANAAYAGGMPRRRLPPGTYTVTITGTGFYAGTTRSYAITVEAGQVLEISAIP